MKNKTKQKTIEATKLLDLFSKSDLLQYLMRWVETSAAIDIGEQKCCIELAAFYKYQAPEYRKEARLHGKSAEYQNEALKLLKKATKLLDKANNIWAGK